MWINPHSKNITKVLEMLLKHLLRKRAMVCSIKINFYIKLFFRKISWFYDFIEFDDATAVDKVLNIKQHIVNGSTWLVNKAVPKYLNNPAQLIHIRHLNFIIVGNIVLIVSFSTKIHVKYQIIQCNLFAYMHMILIASSS
jgi:hypothetical protein